MKILRQIAIGYTLFMLLVLLAFLYINRQFSFAQRDLVRYNELLHKVEAEILAGERESVIEKRYHCEIILSNEINDPELAEMYRDSAFILDLAPNGEYIGKVAWPDELDRYNAARNGFFVTSIVLWSLVLIAGYLMFLYFYKYLVRPIKELRSFSVEVAKGNLDVALPMHRYNVFGEFVEAFDLMREQLVESKKREIESEKARKELMTELSHDIKTPVAVIKATCEVLEAKTSGELNGGETVPNASSENELRKSITDKEIREKTSTISQKADTISRIVSNIMHANLEDLEQIDVNPTEENSMIIRDFIGNLKHYGNIIIENEIPGCLVYMDRLRLEQAIDNVVGNSYKYAGTDIHVSFDSFTVEMPPESANGMMMMEKTGNIRLKKVDFLRIRIKDDGPGVNEDDLPLIAEKYYRGSNAAGQTGSGLGFFLVKYYLEKMRGGVEYYNDDGFVVELLLRKV